MRSKETLDWLERMFGKIRQVSLGASIDRNRTGASINERMDKLIPASFWLKDAEQYKTTPFSQVVPFSSAFQHADAFFVQADEFEQAAGSGIG